MSAESREVNAVSLRVTIDVPAAECTRCGVQAKLTPQILRLASAGGRNDGFHVTDSDGNSWGVQAADRPRGWTPGPGGGADLTKGLCPACSAAFAATAQAFLNGAAPEAEADAPTPPQPAPRAVTKRPAAVTTQPPPGESSPTRPEARVAAIPTVAEQATVAPAVVPPPQRVMVAPNLGTRPAAAPVASPIPTAPAPKAVPTQSLQQPVRYSPPIRKLPG
jgi:hypothetical protein